MMDWELKGPNAMVEDAKRESLGDEKNRMDNQKQLDACAEGFDILRLSTLMGSEAAHAAEIEELYGKMLAKIEGFSKLVEQTNAEVVEQENRNMRLRHRVACLE